MIKFTWIWNLSQACEPQIFIQKLEAIYESFGQSLSQLVLLWKTYDIFENKTNLFEYYFVFISFLFSAISMSQRFISDDEIFLTNWVKKQISTCRHHVTMIQAVNAVDAYHDTGVFELFGESWKWEHLLQFGFILVVCGL